MKKSKSIIKMITHPYPEGIMQARRDHAHITGQDFVEKPWWYEDTQTGRLYHDLFGCVGWPPEASDNTNGVPGYAAIIAILRPNDSQEHHDPRDAKFLLLCEAESFDVPTLLDDCIEMREKYGFGIQPDLLNVWRGDPERFVRMLALKNERLIERDGDRSALLITPPEDFYAPMIFDNYVRSLQSTLVKRRLRLYLGKCQILQTRIKRFLRNDPAIMAVGGLIHTLLSHCVWMDFNQSNVFTVDEEW